MRDGEEHTPITLSLVNTSSSLVCRSVEEAIDYKNDSSLNQLLRDFICDFVHPEVQKMRSEIHKLSSYWSNLYSIVLLLVKSSIFFLNAFHVPCWSQAIWAVLR